MGRIVGLFGVKGWVKVFSFTDPRDAILEYQTWLVGSGNNWTPVKVSDGKRQGKGVIALLDETVDRDDAARWMGQDIAVLREQMPALDDNRFYWSDLEGLTVMQKDGETLGVVDYVLETGANDVLVVKGDIERLIPFVMNDTIVDVDLANGVIKVDWDWD